MTSHKDSPPKEVRRELLKANRVQLLEFATSVLPAGLANKVLEATELRKRVERSDLPSGMVFQDFCRLQFMRCDEVLKHLHETHRPALLVFAKSLAPEIAPKLVSEHLELTKQYRSGEGGQGGFNALEDKYFDWAKKLFGRSSTLIQFLFLPRKTNLESWAENTDSEMFHALSSHFAGYERYPLAYSESRHAELFHKLNEKLLYYIQRCCRDFNPVNESFDQYAKRTIERLYCGHHHIENDAELVTAEGSCVSYQVNKVSRKGQDGAEIRQYVFEQLLDRHSASFDHNRGFKWNTYICRAINSAIADFYRKRSKYSSEVQLPDKFRIAKQCTVSPLEVTKILRRCLRCLERKFPDTYSVVIGSVVEGKKLQSFGVEETAAYNRKKRGLDRLRKCLGIHGVKTI